MPADDSWASDSLTGLCLFGLPSLHVSWIVTSNLKGLLFKWGHKLHQLLCDVFCSQENAGGKAFDFRVQGWVWGLKELTRPMVSRKSSRDAFNGRDTTSAAECRSCARVSASSL